MQARLLALLLPGFFPLFAQPAAPERGTVEGTVTHAVTGRPIAGARVRLQSGQQDPLFTLTDDQGHYQFTGLDFAGYQLNVAKPGFVRPGEGPNATRPTGFVVISTRRPHAEFPVALQPQAVIAGRVLDASGAPLPDAVVYLLRKRPLRPGQQPQPVGLPPIQQIARVTTNDLGEYRLAPLTEGAYYLQVQPGFPLRSDKSYHETYYPRSPDLAAAKQIEVGYGQEIRGLDIRMIQVRGVRVTGRLINAPEQPEGVRPRAYTRLALARPEPELRNYSVPFAAVTNEGFELSDVLPGRYILEALTQGVPGNPADARMQRPFLWARVPIVVSESGLDGVEVTLQPTLEVSGKLKFGPGCRAVRAAIRVFADSSRLGGMVEVVSADDGTFVLGGLVPGTYRVDMSRRAGLPWPVSAQLDGKNALSGFEVNGVTKGPLEITMACAEAGVNR